MKKRLEKEPNFLHMLGDNGWMWQTYKEWYDEDYYKYKCTFLNVYRTEVLAVVACAPHHLVTEGHYGVLWLEAVGYPDCCRDENNGYSFGDIQDILTCLEIAEENLVRIGVPFCPDYKFHGRNKANLKRRNDATRKKLNMDHWEEIAWQQENKRREKL